MESLALNCGSHDALCCDRRGFNIMAVKCTKRGGERQSCYCTKRKRGRPSTNFDKRAYQREYMRRRRAKAKEERETKHD